MAGVQSCSLFARASEVDDALLYGVMVNTTRTLCCLPGYEGMSSGFNRESLGLNCDEVYPNVLIGNAACARDKDYLRRIGTTHVLNAAMGTGVGMVDTNQDFYVGCGVTFLGIPLVDDPSFEVSPYFQTAVEFVSCGVESGGKVLVHCVQGKSRSVCLAVAYLMIKVGMPAPMALKVCCTKLEANINIGFLSELATLHNCLCNLTPQ